MYTISMFDMIQTQFQGINNMNDLFEKTRKVLNLLIPNDKVIIGMVDRHIIESYKNEDKGYTQRVYKITKAGAMGKNITRYDKIAFLYKILNLESKSHMKTSKITNKRINKGNVVLDREAHFDDFEACFEDIDEALKGVRKDNKMCQ